MICCHQQNLQKIESNTIDYVNADFDYQILLQDYLNDGLITTTTKNILLNFFELYTNASGFSDVELMVNDYSNMVIESDIDENDKKSLLSALSVAAKTPYIWSY
jgi:hypothetical protein